MIPGTEGRKVETNLQGEQVKMGFAKGAEQHLMRLLTRQYSDPELACIREYSTNAFDSHTEAGNQDPILVTTPSPLSPYFKVKDFGVGLSVEDIHTLYSQYGASTKRDSNSFNGMLGIGCKAALAYASQFTLIGVKDGVRCVVAVSRDEDGAGSMTIVDTSATKEPNGVEVSIPARGGHSFAQKAKEFFKHWPAGSVLIDGKPPVKPERMLDIDTQFERMYVIASELYSAPGLVVMGNVAYPAAELSVGNLGLQSRAQLVVHVPIGAVDFAPSREALELTSHTKRTISAIQDDFKRNTAAAVSKRIENAPTRHAALSEILRWKRVLGRSLVHGIDTLRYKNTPVPTSISSPTGTSGMILTTASDYRAASASTVRHLDVSYLPDTVWITGFDPVKMTRTHKLKMLQHRAKKYSAMTIKSFVLVNFPLDTTWIDPARVWKWEDVKAEVLPKKPRSVSTGGGRLQGSYDCVIKVKGSKLTSKTEVAAADIDFSNPVFYHHGNCRDSYYIVQPLTLKYDDFTVICLPANRLDKFKRENPSIKSATEAIDAVRKTWDAKLTDDERLSLYFRYHGYTSTFGYVAAKTILSKIEDNRIVEAVRIAAMDTASLYDAANQLGYDFNKLTVKWTDPLDDYPFLNRRAMMYMNVSRQYATDYINLFYRQSQQAKAA